MRKGKLYGNGRQTSLDNQRFRILLTHLCLNSQFLDFFSNNFTDRGYETRLTQFF